MPEPRRITRRIADSDALDGQYPAFLKLLDEDRETTLELVLAPGEFGRSSRGPISLTLVGAAGQARPPIDVVLRGEADRPAPVLSDMQATIACRDLLLEGLAIRGRRAAEVLGLGVARSLTLRRCLLDHNDLLSPFGGPLFDVRGTSRSQPLDIRFEGCWFVGNRAIEPGGMLAVHAPSGGVVRSVEFVDCGFLGNEFPIEVLVSGAAEVWFRDCLIHKPRYRPPERDPGVAPTFTFAAPAGVPLRFEGSTILVHRAADLATCSATVSNSSLFAAAADEVPERLILEGVERPTDGPSAADLAGLAGAIVAADWPAEGSGVGWARTRIGLDGAADDS